ncbi:MAG: hypothetical protein KAS32_25360 [Candidatus Peribacteraceae bacterium]|nr:hypothetical protein [Candidatus Peribacteraceae bacterium]
MADLKAKSDSLLSTTTVAFNAAAQTTLYTVPVGKSCVITKVIVIAGADCVDAEITIGVTASWDNWLGTNGMLGANLDLDELDAAGEYCIISPTADADPVAAASVLTRYTAGEVIKVDVTNSGGGATNTIMLFGILY